ncbi:hypothetical protein [Corynebacterium oculi]|uniref:Uncharacterized protein n=1 Tax=Corynebacterium oculi TaxID=1544416 RepID=A0A0Q1AB09_9CORY|nr:hypothetical protein [Corynebacterium oculi]KQB83887.1 hypothetical protein Cocul_01963 [Corynebacterium oculi]
MAPTPGRKSEDTLIFQKVLQGQLKRYIGSGQVCLGRLGKGEAKPGQSAPWMLGDFTEQDAQVAQRYLNSKQPATGQPSGTSSPAQGAAGAADDLPF